MTDERTTPDADARRKRAAPTIDLTATEVRAAPAADAPPPATDVPPPPPPAEEPPTAEREVPFTPEPEAPDKSAGRPGGNFIAATLAAGAVGAAVMALILVGLWLGGLIPVGEAGSAATPARIAGLEAQLRDLQSRPAGAPDTKSIDALSGRIAKLEAALSKLPAGDTGLSERVAAVDNITKSLGIAVTALSRRGDDVAANAAQARDRAEAAEKAVNELRANLQNVAKDAAGGIASVELDVLQKRIAGLEQSVKLAREDIAKTAAKAAVDTPARLALSAATLRNAALSGAPFAETLAQVRSLGADEAAMAPLVPYAATGVPTQAKLAHELQALMPAMLKASDAPAPAGGFLERLQANAGKLVRVRPVDAPLGDDAPSVLARIELAAAHADIAAALGDLGKLPAAARAPAQDWIGQANARQAALAAANRFAAEAARALGQK